MPAKRKPAYLLHQATGQARVRIDGKDHYLGAYGSPESRDRYDDLLAEWLVRQDTHRVSLTLDELALTYLQYAQSYYVKDGVATAEVDCLRSALRQVIRHFGPTRAREFSPLRLKRVREAMIGAGLRRSTINRHVDRIRRMFRWAVSEDMLPPAIAMALSTVAGLRRGKSGARESEPVKPVSDEVIERTLPHLPKVVADMVRFQRLTGCRPGEVCQLRPCDVDARGDVWEYRPASHKSDHHDRERRIYLGPQAQAILRPYLVRSAECYCFSPQESETRRRLEQNARRKTPLGQGNGPGSNRKKQPKRVPQLRYKKGPYCRAIARACEIAFQMPLELRRPSTKLPEQERQQLRLAAATWRTQYCWTPNQLRHTAGTEIRHRFGLEAAQAALGHSMADVTQIYAERDFRLAASVAKQMG